MATGSASEPFFLLNQNGRSARTRGNSGAGKAAASRSVRTSARALGLSLAAVCAAGSWPVRAAAVSPFNEHHVALDFRQKPSFSGASYYGHEPVVIEHVDVETKNRGTAAAVAHAPFSRKYFPSIIGDDRKSVGTPG